jgi:Flp pilus assembly protein TadD
VLRLEPGQFQARANLDNALRDLGRLEEAAAQYLEALRLQPDEPDLHAGLGSLLYSLGRSEEAAWHTRESARLRKRRGKP